MAPFGIIPARAGFTAWCRPWRPWTPDHPRSRGVYLLRRQHEGPDSGSSPLARGLLVGTHPNAVLRRIIPARAGFTSTVGGQDHRSGDHPRSRGVYMTSAPSRWLCQGSSPLARGLLLFKTLLSFGIRIIPARAGFTPPAHPEPPAQPDHPRSRGVYCAWCSMLASRGGSSPLARGLQAGQRRSGSPAWIIPARAGFTRFRTGLRSAARDHPRSRGVYPLPYRPALGRPGSSPLARGLQGVGHDDPLPSRIIPARAGFTH